MKKNQRWINISLLVVSLILPFLVFESHLRVSHSIEKNKLLLRYDYKKLNLAFDNELIYRGIPNKDGNNSHGYWDYEYSYRKDPGIYRIIVIGDSIALGQGIKLEESFSKVLEKKLKTLIKSKKFEVIKLAQTGYSTSQELLVLKQESFCYNPDAIIWSYCLNDPADPVFHNANGELGRYFYTPTVYIFDFFRKKYLSFIEHKRMMEYKCKNDIYDSFLHFAYWDQVQKNIREIAKITQKRDIPVFFVIHPDFLKKGNFNDYPLYDLHKKLFMLAISNGLIPIDLLDCYKLYDSEEIRLRGSGWFDCWHLNAKGHLVVANYIYKFMQRYLNQ